MVKGSVLSDEKREARFWGKVDKGRDGGCWIWTGSKVTRGYGVMRIAGKGVRAHRFSWKLANGPIPDGASVLHRCDVPACVNPDHLFIGTDADNVRDCIEKNRRVYAFGVSNGNSRLTKPSVIAIIEARNRGESCRALAQRYQVSPRTVRAIFVGERWPHVNRRALGLDGG